MKKMFYWILATMVCGMTFVRCASTDVTDGNTADNDLKIESIPWLKKLIEISKTDNTGNYWGCIWLEKFEGKEVYVTSMMLGSGGIMYYFFNKSGALIVPKGSAKYTNPLIEAFAGKDAFAEVDEKWFDSFHSSMKLNNVVYSSFSFPCER